MLHRAHWGLLAVLTLSFCLNLFPLWWGLPAWNAWAFDEIRPKVVLQGLERHFSGGWAGPYPPLHYYVLGALYWPPTWAQSAGRLEVGMFQLISLLFVLGRTLSVLLATATVYLVYRCARLLGDRPTAVLAALITALIVPFVFYAKTINLDVPYLFWFVFSVFFLLRVLDRHRFRDYLALAATATFAVCTKDQAFAFYVLVPVGLWLDLYRHRRRDPTQAARLPKVLLDRRLLVSGFLAAGLFALIHNLLFNFDGFRRHLWLITHRSPSLFKLYEPTLSGYGALILKSIEHLAFSMGVPLFLICVWGVIETLRRPRQDPRLLALLGLGLSYYVFFIMVVRHNYVRFLLPICILLSFFGGRAVMRLVRSRKVPRLVMILLVSIVLSHAFLRALSVDFLMHWDPRYRVEKWIAENVDDDELALAVGRQNMLPRGLEIIPWSRLRRHGLGYIDARDADYLVISTDDLAGPRRQRVHSALAGGGLGFELVFQHRGRPPLNLLDTTGIFTNLSTLNPEIEVYRRLQLPPGE